MKILLTALLASFLVFASSYGRIMNFGSQSEYGIKECPQGDLTYINPETWDVFTDMDAGKIFGVDSASLTVFQVEYLSTAVIEGIKVGQNTAVASFSDKRGFFGGEGYMDLYYMQSADDYYAGQARFVGGWKYNLNYYLDLDLGGNIYYATKDIVGPGLPGGGYKWGGDIYAGLIIRNVYVAPFCYVGYNDPLDALKIMAGFAPIVDLAEFTGIQDLYLENCFMYGYTSANRWSADTPVGGQLWQNGYGYVQLESNIVYVYDEHWKTSAGIGYSYNNDGEVGPGGFEMGPDQNLWVNISFGYVF